MRLIGLAVILAIGLTLASLVAEQADLKWPPVGSSFVIAHNVLIFVVARTRLGRYEELRQSFEHWRHARVVLDRREGERRRTPQPTFAGVDQRRVERRQWRPDLRKLGWFVVDTDDLS
jgi:hypothetical protein